MSRLSAPVFVSRDVPLAPFGEKSDRFCSQRLFFHCHTARLSLHQLFSEGDDSRRGQQWGHAADMNIGDEIDKLQGYLKLKKAKKSSKN